LSLQAKETALCVSAREERKERTIIGGFRFACGGTSENSPEDGRRFASREEEP
jgi:hypothetical protein